MFPEFLRPDFEEEVLDASPSSIAVLEPSGLIVWANRAWHRRGAEHAMATHLSGSYFAGITLPLRGFFEDAFADAFASRGVFELEYDCPTPAEQRRFHMRVLPVDAAGLLVEHSLMVSTPADAGEPAIAARYANPKGIITQCSNCRRVVEPATAAWHWVPDWVRQPSPQTSHGLCPSCEGFYWGQRARRSKP